MAAVVEEAIAVSLEEGDITVITFTPASTSPVTGSIQLVATPPNTGSATVTLKGIVKVKK